MSEDLVEIERIAGALLRQLSSGQRRTLLRRMARTMATRNRGRIKTQTAPDGTPFEPRRNADDSSLRRRGRLRSKIMFRRLATARLLRSGADDHGFWIGFAGRTAQIARVHHEGLRDRPSSKAKPIAYPRRPLLGFSEQDREALLDMLYAQLAAAD